MTIRKRMLLILVAAAIPGMAVAIFLASSALQDEQRRSAQTAEWLARLQASYHSNEIENAKTILDMVRQTAVAVDRADSLVAVDCTVILKKWPALSGSFTSLSLFSPQGEAVCTGPDSELSGDVADSAWFRDAVAGSGIVFSDYTRGENGTPLIVAAQAFAGADGAVQGVFALGIDLNWLGYVSRNIDLPEGARVIALDSQGRLLTEQTNEPPADAEGLIDAIQARIVEDLSGVLASTDPSGQDRVYGFALTDVGNLTVIVDLPTFVPYARAAEALFKTIAAPMAILLLALLATAWASETFVVRWVRSLTATADELAEGNLDVRTDVPYSQGEIGQLAETFDEMADAIERQHEGSQTLITQREGQLKEMSHRTANNLAVLSSLVDLERRRQGRAEPSTGTMLMELSGRIRTLASIHRMLHERIEDSTATERREAIEQLIDMLADFYHTPDARVVLSHRIEPLDLDTDRAVTFALLLNELICNAYKHAFRPGDSGALSVDCRTDSRDGEDRIRLTVQDDGRGLPDDFDPRTALTIATALVRQLEGSIDVADGKPGTRVEVAFPARAGSDAADRPADDRDPTNEPPARRPQASG